MDKITMVKRLLKTGLASPEFIWRIVVAICVLAGTWWVVQYKVEEALRLGHENAIALATVNNQITRYGAIVESIDKRTQRMENFMDQRSLQQRGIGAIQLPGINPFGVTNNLMHGNLSLNANP